MKQNCCAKRLAAMAGVVLALAGLRVAAAENYSAHEWGTFTSVQGADGVQFEWNPLITSELPRFVYDRTNPTGDPKNAGLQFLSKGGLRTLQRMETPVIYFYSDHALSVDVEVRFPQGLVTEWFPLASNFGPFTSTNKTDAETRARSFIEWKGVQVLPQTIFAGDDRTLPSDSSGSHYFAARATDANILREEIAGKIEHEKFLFYRGVGNFRAPLQATLQGNDDFVTLKNTGTNELRNLFVLQIYGGAGRRIFVQRLAAQEEQAIPISNAKDEIPLPDLQAQIRREMEAGLIAEGLYAREAAAMVATWNDSWFSENGLRVLYVLPRRWTDQTLPMALSPAPRDLVRVMVGRAELITPSMEWSLIKNVVKFCDNDPGIREQAVAETKQLGLGRFLEPTVRRILGKNPSKEFNDRAWNLVDRTIARGQPAPGNPPAQP